MDMDRSPARDGQMPLRDIMDKKKRKNEYALERLFGRILSPFEAFLKRTTAGGIVLMGTTVLTLIAANSAWGDAFLRFWEQRARFGIGSLQFEMSLHDLINDGLMSLFFLVVGLELKREMKVGELSSWRDAALPVFAAAGGMVVPALIYYAVNPHGTAAAGWGIPMATDIAFAVGILVLLSWRIPSGLIIFLTALAIADDLGAVLVIALFYTHEISLDAIGFASAVLFLLLLLNRGGIRHAIPYGVLGVLLWLALHHSGVHSTLAGVLLAFAIPARPARAPAEFERRLVELQNAFHAEAAAPDFVDQPLSNPRMATIAETLERNSRAVQSPLQRMEHRLGPWVTFVVIPLFALNNVGIDFEKIALLQGLCEPVTMGVCLGLVFGKFTGISVFSWIAVKLGIGRLPSEVRWRHLLGVAWLGGIGFTMSLFISQLAFDDRLLQEQAKLGILTASLLSAMVGMTWLYFGGTRAQPNRK